MFKFNIILNIEKRNLKSYDFLFWLTTFIRIQIPDMLSKYLTPLKN